MLTARNVKQLARELGADAVGIAPIDRFEGAPVQMDPRQIMPEARSVVAMAFRVMRGSLRGIEEGTFFSNYSAMGYGGLTYLYIPLVVINLCKAIEDAGFEAVPIGHQSDWRGIDNNGRPLQRFSRPVGPGKPLPTHCRADPQEFPPSMRPTRWRSISPILSCLPTARTSIADGSTRTPPMPDSSIACHISACWHNT